MPVFVLAFLVRCAKPDRGRRFRKTILTRKNLLREAECPALFLPIQPLHPLVVEVDDPRVGTIVHRQPQLLTAVWREELWELEDVANCGPSKAVEALVIVTDDAEVTPVAREKEQDLFLDRISVLVLIDHQVRNFVAQLSEHVRVSAQELQSLVLDAGEVQAVIFFEKLLVLEETTSERAHLRIRRGFKNMGIQGLFADLVQPLHQLFRLRPPAGLVIPHYQLRIRKLSKILDLLIEEVLLIELVKKREASPQAGELTKFFQ